MEFRIEMNPDETARWGAFWLGLAEIAELGPRETEILADVGRRAIAANFEREQSPEGQPWEPLAPMTQRQRAMGIDYRGIPFRVSPHHPILVRTQDLKLSFTDPRHPRNITAVERAAGKTMITLSAVDDPETPGRIALLHAGGYTQPRWFLGAGWGIKAHYVPPRPFIGFSDLYEAQLEAQAANIIIGRLERLRGI